MNLPIDEIIPEVVAVLRQHPAVVIQAPPGAGKTTRIPLALIDAGLGHNKRLVMLEPRRIAARTAALQLARQRQQPVGQSVGYQVRFERKVSAQTEILVVTEGILPRLLVSDPYLESVSILVFDEFHERSLDNDFALGIARLLQKTVRPDLRIVVMSATLHTPTIAQFLDNCPIVTSQGRQYPVDIQYQPRTSHQPWSTAIVQATQRLLDHTPGDLLVFLPGVAEIKQTQRELLKLPQFADIHVLPLYGDLPAEQQDEALRKSTQRRIVLATNVAETSVTVDGVTAVVDSGWARVKRFDSSIGLDRLELSPISQSSADQRAGRAGRQQPGVCVRLWSAAQQATRPAFIEPEIQRVDLAHTILQLLAYGEATVDSFPWLDPPKPRSVQKAVTFLQQMKAISGGDNDSPTAPQSAPLQLTPLGKQLAQLPVQPRIGRLLLASQQFGCVPYATLAAALLSERSPFAVAAHHPLAPPPHARSSTPVLRHTPCACDIVERVEALLEFERTGATSFPCGELQRAGARRILQVRQQLTRLLSPRDSDSSATPSRSSTSATDTETADSAVQLRRALFAAFADRLARRREPNSARGLMVGGRGVRLAPSSAVTTAEFFVGVDLEAGKGESLVRLASAVERNWLPQHDFHTQVQVDFDPDTQKMSARRRFFFRDLLLDESPAALPHDASTARALAAAAVENLSAVLPPPESAAGQLIERLRWLQATCPDLQLPSCSAAQLATLLPELCAGQRSFDDLRGADWSSAVHSLLTPVQQQALRREAPDRLEVPSGNRLTVHYESGRPPTLSVRIQEIFGWKDTPRVGFGRVRILLQLLGPNYRPQQLTDDLASFWNNGYPIVRKELKRRYPKHSWPEDPWTATAEQRPKKRS